MLYTDDFTLLCLMFERYPMSNEYWTSAICNTYFSRTDIYRWRAHTPTQTKIYFYRQNLASLHLHTQTHTVSQWPTVERRTLSSAVGQLYFGGPNTLESNAHGLNFWCFGCALHRLDKFSNTFSILPLLDSFKSVIRGGRTSTKQTNLLWLTFCLVYLYSFLSPLFRISTALHQNHLCAVIARRIFGSWFRDVLDFVCFVAYKEKF